MAFSELPVAGKYALIGGIALGCTVLLILGRYMWTRRRQRQMAYKHSNKSVEEATIDEKDEKLGFEPPRIASLPISLPVVDLDLKEEYDRTASLIPIRPAAAFTHQSDSVKKAPESSEPSKRPHPSELRLRQGSVHSEFSHVPTEFHIAARSPGIVASGFQSPIIIPPTPTSAGLRPLSYAEMLKKREPKIVEEPVAAKVKGERAGDPGETPKVNDPRSIAYGSADLPYSPPKRNYSKKTYEPAGSLRRKRGSVHDPNTTGIVRRGSTTSAAGARRNKSQRSQRSSGSNSDWVDTLTMVDDQEHASNTPSEPGIMPVSQPAPRAQDDLQRTPRPHRDSLTVPTRQGRGSSRRSRGNKQASKAQRETSPGHTVRNNALIAEEMAAIKYSTKKGISKSPTRPALSDAESID
ncbi:hypothetical protein H072_7650 [Dactylellina haptotyla CBS 200.50]|uniref:Uncharacterized protein n=1 Tax=Dactylellina haptotyla (strain CBS 200.50) TaxID=1284197 RepID=S8BTI0_DACHA|nr:hypothetical protein H072_7650 [Dactylellina haptotyla CBS 200.50]